MFAKFRKNLGQIDVVNEPVPDSVEPALDPQNQHTHISELHGGHAHGDSHIIYANKETPAHYDSKDVAQDADLESQESLQRKPDFWDYVKKYNWAIVLFLGLFFTSWWISILAQDKTRPKWLIPTFLYWCLMIRLITFYVPTRPLLDALNWVYKRTFVKVRDMIPKYLWVPIEFLALLVFVLVATFATPETPDSTLSDRGVSFFGYVVIYSCFALISKHKKQIRWHTIVWGLLLQFAVALFVLRTKAGYDFFSWISFLTRTFLGFSGDGVAFLSSAAFVAEGWFVVTAICAVIFFVATIHILYYYGIVQWLVGKCGQGVFWLMRVSGAEAVVVVASPFFGIGESAALIKAFLPRCTEAEIFQVLVSGFSTISGSVLAAYIHMGVDPGALITSCVMSIPASISAAKLVLPETEESLTSDKAIVPEDTTEEACNVMHAFSNGASFGLNIGFSMFTNIMCIIAMVALVNAVLTWFGKFWGIPHLTLEQIFGYIFYPVSFLIGVSRDGDIYKVAKLIGTKLVENEFVSFMAITQQEEYINMSKRSKILATFALSGFANLGSCGIQIGVLSAIAPKRKGVIASQIFLSLIVGCLCTVSSACVAGMVMTDTSRFVGA